METNLLVNTLVTSLHNLFTLIWMGGLIITVISFLPSLRKSLGPGPQVKKVMAAFQQKQSIWVYISIVVLIITGLMLDKQNGSFTGLFKFDDLYSSVLSIKHILVILMIVVSVFRSRLVNLISANNPKNQEKLNLTLLLINTALAFLVIISSSFLAAFTSSVGV